MNTTDATRASDKAMPEDNQDAANCAAIPSHTIGMQEIRRLSGRDLRNVYEAVDLAAEALAGIINQPRFNIENEHKLNAAGEVLDGIIDYLMTCNHAFIEEAKRRKPVDPDEVEERGWLLFRAELNNFGGLPEFAALAAAVAAQKAKADFQAQRRMS